MCYPITEETDVALHKTVSWMRRLKIPTGEVTRWLQELDTSDDLEVVRNGGNTHSNADELSRKLCKVRKPLHQEGFQEAFETFTNSPADSIKGEIRALKSWTEGFADKKERLERRNSGWKDGELIIVDSTRKISKDRSEVEMTDDSWQNKKRTDKAGTEGTIDRKKIKRRERKRKQPVGESTDKAPKRARRSKYRTVKEVAVRWKFRAERQERSTMKRNMTGIGKQETEELDREKEDMFFSFQG